MATHGPPSVPDQGQQPLGGVSTHARDGAQHEEDDDEGVVEEQDAESMAMMQMMGFSAFDSTAGKSVDDPRCKMEAVKKKGTRKYRQYMNRKGGFNRPLEKV